MKYLTHFLTIVVVTHIAALTYFVMLWYFSGLDQALVNISGWHETVGGEVVFYNFNLLHYLAMTYFPAMMLAPIWSLIDWVNKPRKKYNTATGRPLADIKL